MLDFFFCNELKTQLIRYPPSSCTSRKRALPTPVHHWTWTGSSAMFETLSKASFRKLQACVAAEGGFFRVTQTYQTAPRRLKPAQDTTSARIRHSEPTFIFTKKHRGPMFSVRAASSAQHIFFEGGDRSENISGFLKHALVFDEDTKKWKNQNLLFKCQQKSRSEKTIHQNMKKIKKLKNNNMNNF